MYLTNRDKKILKFIEEYKSITINQCSKIFFSKCKQNYYQARKRLKLLSDNKHLKRYRKDMRSETIYYLDKKLSIHDLKVLDIYAELINKGAEIKYFKREYTIPTKNKEYRADGLIECTKDGYFYPILIEVDYTHFTSNKKLLDIYNSNYFQDKYEHLDIDIFPTVLIVRPFISSSNNNLPFNIIYSTMCINNINTLFN
ncbi:hypothetical protein EXM56_02500 [Clostridium botulinum]|uniref:Replication-relaxation family protein n=1 Tax=Clostridium botulinum TaxID=1491 RepID=A0A6G4CNM3_CLOBO|nr:hypothetical protein [Clostridium botulinum]NEZ99747.1 hypothetical protein [Clostridium botulinum]NFA31193.1 hypothetical protein [Clostridium botulinum]NFA85487.1 hypothetical protein [Clostridium botulinum]NFB06687.1 hypothetical protein [Clostridium botulinum]